MTRPRETKIWITQQRRKVKSQRFFKPRKNKYIYKYTGHVKTINSLYYELIVRITKKIFLSSWKSWHCEISSLCLIQSKKLGQVPSLTLGCGMCRLHGARTILHKIAICCQNALSKMILHVKTTTWIGCLVTNKKLKN